MRQRHSGRSIWLLRWGLLAAASATATPLLGATNGNIAAGLVATSGSADSRSINLEYALNHASGSSLWRYQSQGKLLQARSEVEIETAGVTRRETRTTNENYQLELRAERGVDENNYVFAQLKFYRDMFATVRRSTSETVGLGRRLIASEQTRLDLELGLGARQQTDQARQRDDNLIGTLKLNYEAEFGNGSQFSQTVAIESGDANTLSQSQSRLKLAIIGSLWAQLGFDLRHNSRVEAPSSSTDTTTSVSLLWSFGEE